MSRKPLFRERGRFVRFSAARPQKRVADGRSCCLSAFGTCWPREQGPAFACWKWWHSRRVYFGERLIWNGRCCSAGYLVAVGHGDPRPENSASDGKQEMDNTIKVFRQQKGPTNSSRAWVAEGEGGVRREVGAGEAVGWRDQRRHRHLGAPGCRFCCVFFSHPLQVKARKILNGCFAR